MWDGTLFSKSIGSVKFVPLTEMTARDWEWLDYDNIRTVAKNRIAGMIVRGELLGFFQVLIKAHKQEYFWPADDDMRQTHGSISSGGGGDETGNFFGYVKEVDKATDSVEVVEDLRRRVSFYDNSTLVVLFLVLHRLMRRLHIHIPPQQREEHQLKMDLMEDGADLAYLNSLRETDRDLLVSIMIRWALTVGETIAVLENLPEDAGVDGMEEYVRDTVAQVQQTNRSIAASRGTKHIFG